MKNFDINAISLTIRFTCEDMDETVELGTSVMPVPNYMAETIHDSENSDEEVIEYDDNHRYRVVLYANTAEGNVEVFNEDTGEEIENFEVESHFAEE